MTRAVLDSATRQAPDSPAAVPQDLGGPADDRPPRLSVVVPTRNEAENVPLLIARLIPLVAPLGAEILVVDDSDDDTPAVLARAALDAPLPVRLLHRPAHARTGGLSGAVLLGAGHARGDWILVMDADLQHPPETAAMLAAIAMRHDVDVVIGTRYAGNGSREGLDGPVRETTSSWATRLVKSLFPRRLATVSDPMSGLFAVRRDAIRLDRMNPTGFKVLLELLVRHPGARVAEVAYEMATRHAGRSKASLREGLTFLRHLSRLRGQRLVGQIRTRPRTLRERLHELGRLVAFGLVGLSGMVVNTAVLWFCYEPAQLHHLFGAAVATQVSTSWNFLLVDNLIYRRNRRAGLPARATRFFLLNNALLLLRLPVLQALVWAGVGVLAANAVTLGALFLLRFLVNDRVIYTADDRGRRDPVRMLVAVGGTETLPTPSRRRYQYLKYRYDVAGVVTIGSQIRLPELEFFRAQWVPGADVDIAVRVADVGGRGPQRRAAMTQYASQSVLRYEEQLGRLGANFRIQLGQAIDIQVGPLLARSPHVVYTNIIEALLRFVMVSRGHMLLHSACVTLDGVGVMLSALTDTGKTATVLRLLRDHGGLFLSDDMTIVRPDGVALCFPKPLTISAHTLRAVQAQDLTPREWRRLQIQSRLHSRGGRSLALALARFNLPIMGINALTQLLVPPPKYSVDRLVPCRMGTSTRVEELFVIERGAPGISDLDPTETLERMIDNTDDAYGFPPFRYLAPAITIDGQGYTQLRHREREILAGFLSTVRGRVVSSDCFGWADEIPRLLREERGEASRRGGVPSPVWPRWDAHLVATGGAG
ncbi:glycosyltransferase [Micromonospora inyonensis]|uniref:Glycosyltransferase involved in cell wall bisynthesis n=1 Tax=Micromonospora inyonensis TaxID=47866 RepID=A0A1C6RQR0_9ACTN|nr:glycosyltransferase family 2 protein [Micromonospora inyonensis]SCL19399.1 Glycosyltransferase involved in cell wall bisynthesis [Micromonospora inyonensis]